MGRDKKLRIVQSNPDCSRLPFLATAVARRQSERNGCALRTRQLCGGFVVLNRSEIRNAQNGTTRPTSADTSAFPLHCIQADRSAHAVDPTVERSQGDEAGYPLKRYGGASFFISDMPDFVQIQTMNKMA